MINLALMGSEIQHLFATFFEIRSKAAIDVV